MTDSYETEQAALKQESANLETELDAERQDAEDVERFLRLVRSYTEIEELTPAVLNEFIRKIVIHAPDKSSGKRRQKVEIYYRFIGVFNLPDGDAMVEILKRRKARRQASQTKQVKTA